MQAASVRGDRRWIQRTAATLVVTVLVGGVVGCAAPTARPTYNLRLAGAQTPVDYVAAWLADAPDAHFATEKVWPQRYAADGFENLARGTCDLACTDRPLNARELAGLGDVQLQGYRVGFFGYALYVNRENPLDAIYSRHLELVLQGKVTQWAELADPNYPALAGPIHVYGLAKGTRAGQQLSFLARIWFVNPTWTVLDSDAAIVDAVARDPFGLGFAELGYANEAVRYLGLRMRRTGTAAYPSLEEIESERYGLAKVIYVYCRAPVSPGVQAALDYLLSPAAQPALARLDVWPIEKSRAAVTVGQ